MVFGDQDCSDKVMKKMMIRATKIQEQVVGEDDKRSMGGERLSEGRISW